MEYIAHIERERKQSVRDHLYETAELAGSFAESFGKREWGYCCGMLHDIGKYSDAFQDRIQNKSNSRWNYREKRKIFISARSKEKML